MKNLTLSLAVLALITALSGCATRCGLEPSGCKACSTGIPHAHGGGNQHGTPVMPDPPFAGPAGPATASYAYPYYTVRAPRDFLMDNPPSIGR